MSDEREAHHVINGDGRWAVYARGHCIPLHEVQHIADEHLSGDGAVSVSEHHFDKRRMKNCGERDWACEFDGEWHIHFGALKPNDDPATHWTEILRAAP